MKKPLLVLVSLLTLGSCSHQNSHRHPASDRNAIYEDIIACYGNLDHEITYKKKKFKVEERVVAFRYQPQHNEYNTRFVFDRYDAGEIVVLRGSRGGYSNGLEKSRFSQDEKQLALKIPERMESIFESFSSTQRLSLLKNNEGSFSVAVDGFGGVNLETCTRDEEKLKLWIKEVGAFSPF